MIDTPPGGTQANATQLTPERLDQLTRIFPGILHLAGRLAPRSLQEYYTYARYHLDWCDWDPERALDPQTLRLYRQHLVDETRLSPRTINIRVTPIKSLVKASAAIGALDDSVAFKFTLVERVKDSSLRNRIKTHQAYTPEQIRALCQAPDPGHIVGLRDRALLNTLATSGVRISEVVSLRADSIVELKPSWGSRVIGKGQARERLAPLSSEAHRWIEKWLKARARADVDVPWIFTGFRGQKLYLTQTPITKSDAFLRVKLHARSVGLDQLTPHDFRRFLGTRIAQRFGLREAQLALGHALLATLRPGLSEDLY